MKRRDFLKGFAMTAAGIFILGPAAFREKPDRPKLVKLERTREPYLGPGMRFSVGGYHFRTAQDAINALSRLENQDLVLFLERGARLGRLRIIQPKLNSISITNGGPIWLRWQA